MENQLTEFIGLACRRARENLGEDALPQGVVEKMLVLADRQRIAVEGLESRLWRFGSQVAWQPPSLVVDAPPVDLRNITSNYFARNDGGHGLQFQATSHFAEALPILSQKEYFIHYEACISDLLGVWKKGRLDNLLLLTLAGEYGVAALVGDLELMLRELYEYVRTHVYLDTRVRRVDPQGILTRISATDAGLKHKLQLLREADSRRNAIDALPKNVFMYRLMGSSHFLPSDSFLWDVVDQLASEVVEVATMTLDKRLERPMNQLELVPQLKGRVDNLLARTFDGPVVLSGDHRAQLLTLFSAFQRKMSAWLRALLGLNDPTYFAQHRRSAETPYGLRNEIVCYDIKRSTKILDESLSKGSKSSIRELDNWRSKLAAVPRNWAILFGSTLKAEGDQEIALFDNWRAAVHSMAFTLLHIDHLDSLIKDDERPRMGLKAGVGSSPVLVVVDQEMSRAINYLYHAIEDLCTVDASVRQSCSGLALSDFIDQHEHLRKFTTRQVAFRNGTAEVLDFPRIVSDFLLKWTESLDSSRP